LDCIRARQDISTSSRKSLPEALTNQADVEERVAEVALESVESVTFHKFI
jgi:hypothetical protein